MTNLLKYLTDETDKDRGYVHFDEGDEVALLVNNFGGMSTLEMGALTDLFLEKLPTHLIPVRVYTGTFETSLNAPAFALTICNLSAAAKAADTSVSDILSLLDCKTDSAWEAVAGEQRHPQRRPRKEQLLDSNMEDEGKVLDIAELTSTYPFPRFKQQEKKLTSTSGPNNSRDQSPNSLQSNNKFRARSHKMGHNNGRRRLRRNVQNRRTCAPS